MEFDRQSDGTLNPLPAPSIDTGMGLERITAVIQGKISNYDTDSVHADPGGDRRGRRQDVSGDARRSPDVSMRVIADHLRAMTFLIADGVVPSNEWRGYVLRKIMRRAMRHGKKLGFTEPFLHALVDVVVAEMGDAYPELRRNRDAVVQVVRSEEERFDAVLTAGLPRLEDALDRAAAGSKVLPGDEAFRLYDSLGVPLDFMEDLASQRGLVARSRRVRARDGGTARARARGQLVRSEEDAGVRLHVRRAIARTALAPGDQFEGYAATTRERARPSSRCSTRSGARWPSSAQGTAGFVVLERTPFYVESGGQVSDSGTIENEAVGSVGDT